MVTMVARLLEIADQLTRNGSRSSTMRRRAVSTAYYAVFHTLAKSCATALLPSVDKSSELYERVYRALDHGPIKNTFMAKDGSLKSFASLQRIGESVVRLQSERHRADYSSPNAGIFSQDEAETLVARARWAVTEIENLGNEERLALATSLLFKSRPQ